MMYAAVADVQKFLQEHGVLQQPDILAFQDECDQLICSRGIAPLGVPLTPLGEIGCKAAARILLSPIGTSRIVVPDSNEQLGVALLERDDELPRRIVR
jgi:hypothetical protein